MSRLMAILGVGVVVGVMILGGCSGPCSAGSCAMNCPGNDPVYCGASCQDAVTSVYCHACPNGMIDKQTSCDSDAGADGSRD